MKHGETIECERVYVRKRQSQRERERAGKIESKRVCEERNLWTDFLSYNKIYYVSFLALCIITTSAIL